MWAEEYLLSLALSANHGLTGSDPGSVIRSNFRIVGKSKVGMDKLELCGLSRRIVVHPTRVVRCHHKEPYLRVGWQRYFSWHIPARNARLGRADLVDSAVMLRPEWRIHRMSDSVLLLRLVIEETDGDAGWDIEELAISRSNSIWYIQLPEPIAHDPERWIEPGNHDSTDQLPVVAP